MKTSIHLIWSLAGIWLFCFTCAPQESVTSARTMLVIADSVQANRFERSGALIKYMTDCGLPRVIPLGRSIKQYIADADREVIELAFQDSYTVTKHFVIARGDSVVFFRQGNETKIGITNRSTLPWDENYTDQRNKLVFKESESATDKFLRLSQLMNDTCTDVSTDESLLQELTRQKDLARRQQLIEKIMLDSLENYDLISPHVATFFKCKNNFDSLRLSFFIDSRPSYTFDNVLLPFRKFMTHLPWSHLTIYDDWFMNTYSALVSSSLVKSDAVSLLYQVVQGTDINEELKKILLFRIVGNGCPEMTTEGCNALMNSYQNHISTMSSDNVCYKLYLTTLEKNHIFQ